LTAAALIYYHHVAASGTYIYVRSVIAYPKTYAYMDLHTRRSKY